MATYSQWARNRPVKRVAWVCGPEFILREEVVSAYRKALSGAQPVVWTAAQAHERDLWDELLTQPPDGGRLVLVRGADALGKLNFRMPLLLSDGLETSYVVFVSEEDNFAKGEDKALAGYLAALRDSKYGQLIRCCAPAREEDRVALVASWWPGAGRNLAAEMLSRCGEDLTLASVVCTKAVLSGLAPSEKALEVALAGFSVSGGYVPVLIAGDRKKAMRAARDVLPGETGAVLGLLVSRIETLSILRDEVSLSNRDMVQVAATLRIDQYLVRLLRPYAAQYDHAKIARCRELLAIAESAWKSGVHDGILEAVAALW